VETLETVKLLKALAVVVEYVKALTREAMRAPLEW